ncbi:MAG: sulfatase-like hydrolase/transferase [Chitinophagaceae bacterium]|nr:sulfatase-like hydrolase/transferase [Chitinophagaceae bacterium]
MSHIKRITRHSIYLFALLIAFHGHSQRPNIIYIMSDDMGYADLSGYGRKDYTTPNLDKLAAQGIKFVNAYSAAPLCTPTRAAFMTGRYPARIPVGLMEPLTPTTRDSAYGLTADYPSLAFMMRDAGYETALIGKWHLGFRPEHSPIKNGFDYFFGIHSGAADYMSHKGDGRRHDLYENESPIFPVGYMTDLFSQKAVRFLEQKHNKPFFLAVTYTAPHWPWQGRTDTAYGDTMNFRRGGSPARFAAMMQSLDEGVGEIMKALDKQNLSTNTIVIFTNDNGGERFSDNGGLSKGKMTLWEGGIRVPAFIRWPGKITPGLVTEQVAVTMDWTATILAAGRARAHQDFPLDGIDLMPILTSKQATIERTIYWRSTQRARQKGMRDSNWKYLQDENGEYLFDLSNDRGEKTDLKDQQPEVFSKMKEKYTEWEKRVLKPIEL